MGAAPSTVKAAAPCLFCRIATDHSTENPLWWRDESVAVFVPRTPAASLHLLVVPVTHIGTVTSLGAAPGDAALLRRMRDAAVALLAEHDAAVSEGRLTLVGRDAPPPAAAGRGGGPGGSDGAPPLLPNGCQLSFHVPPFNSVDHLHLHALRPPFASLADRVSFLEGTWWCRSFDRVLRAAEDAEARHSAARHGAAHEECTP